MDSFVIGAEADWSWGDSEGAAGSNGTVNCAGTCSMELASRRALRARLGLALGSFIPYVTAGFATGGYQIGISSVTEGHSKGSFTGGGGLEISLTDSLSAKLEHR